MVLSVVASSDTTTSGDRTRSAGGSLLTTGTVRTKQGYGSIACGFDTEAKAEIALVNTHYPGT